MTIWKTDETKGERTSLDVCGLTYQPFLLVEMLQTLRHSEARAHATANHTHEAAQVLSAILMRAGTAASPSAPPAIREEREIRDERKALS